MVSCKALVWQAGATLARFPCVQERVREARAARDNYVLRVTRAAELVQSSDNAYSMTTLM